MPAPVTEKLEPDNRIDLKEHGQIHICAFSPYELSQDLLLVAFENKVLAIHVLFQDGLQYSILGEFDHDSHCTGLTISSETNTYALPANLIFCSAGFDFKLRLYTSNLKNANTCKVLSGHSSFINEVSYDPENHYIASVSDDNTTKIWSTSDHTCVSTLYLTSPGMSVSWHKDDSSKLMVAEKLGIIRFYNVNTQKPILSLDYNRILASAHWAPANSQLVGSLHMGELLLWDLTKPSRPLYTKLIHAAAGGSIRFNSTGELVATINLLEGALKIFLVNSQEQRLHADVVLPTSPTWHYKLPTICIAQDNKLCFWRVSSQ